MNNLVIYMCKEDHGILVTVANWGFPKKILDRAVYLVTYLPNIKGCTNSWCIPLTTSKGSKSKKSGTTL